MRGDSCWDCGRDRGRPCRPGQSDLDFIAANQPGHSSSWPGFSPDSSMKPRISLYLEGLFVDKACGASIS
jgi:hypothetical protein